MARRRDGYDDRYDDEYDEYDEGDYDEAYDDDPRPRRVRRRGPPPDIPNYLVQAILTTICCCQPFGIVAIVYAAQVGSKLTMGDYEGAQQSSDSARTWCWVAFGVGLFVNGLGGAIGFMGEMGNM